MKKAIKEAWLSGLRSGKYKQGQLSLYHEHNDSYCCLGVLCKTANLDIKKEYKDYDNIYQLVNGNRLDTDGNAGTLMKMNDIDDFTFLEIADWIEANIPTED